MVHSTLNRLSIWTQKERRERLDEGASEKEHGKKVIAGTPDPLSLSPRYKSLGPSCSTSMRVFTKLGWIGAAIGHLAVEWKTLPYVLLRVPARVSALKCVNAKCTH